MPNLPVQGSGAPSNGKPYGGVYVPKIFQAANPATHVFIALMLQTLGLVVAVIVAGIDESVATLILIMMVGLLLLFMIMNVDRFQGITSILTNAETGAKL